MIVVEDGTGVVGANSFVTVAELRAYATARGIILPADPGCEPFLVTSFDFLFTVEPRMTGVRTYAVQEGPYPRTGSTEYGVEVAANYIPKSLKKGQLQLALDASQGVPLVANDTAEPAVKREKIGPIDTEYFDGGVASEGASLTLAYSFLDPILTGSTFGIRTVRV